MRSVGLSRGRLWRLHRSLEEQSINLQPLTTEQDGGFSAEISQVPTTVVVRADGYYSARRTVSMGSSYDLGEIALTKTVSDCIQLTLAQVDAVRSGETPQKRYLPNAAGLKFTLTRDGLPVTGFEVQGTTLRFLPGVVDAGDTIQLSVQDTQGNYTAKDVSVTLDESKMGNAQITLTEHGKFYLPTISAAHAVDVMIFDEEGNLVSTKAVQCPVESRCPSGWAVQPGFLGEDCSASQRACYQSSERTWTDGRQRLYLGSLLP